MRAAHTGAWARARRCTDYAVLDLFVALVAVLAVAPLADAGQTETVACCGGTPGFP
ncbi:hypothetical protein [Streptomyces sp. NPDC001530]|uniref:hypothetical protein n=1 Tax=Streptomyces sp. NPDC001530 TaxID=3364582 RepID=UPI00367FEDAA